MKNTFLVPAQQTPHLNLPSHTLTWEQDISHLKQDLPQQDLKIFLDLYSHAQENLRGTKKKLELFKERHPDHPEVLNLLSFIYLSLRKIKKADRLIEENYKRNPYYIFARINYGDLCLRRKQIQKIPEIFNKNFSLQELYPHRKSFHISEFRGFMTLMGFYHLAIQKREAAEVYHYLVSCVDPHHCSTKILEKKLYYIPLRKKLLSYSLNKVSQLTNIIKRSKIVNYKK